MQAVNYSHARNNLKTLIEDICDNDETYVITNKNGKTVMMMSLEEYSRKQAQIKEDVKTSLSLLENSGLANNNIAFQRAKYAYDMQ